MDQSKCPTTLDRRPSCRPAIGLADFFLTQTRRSSRMRDTKSTEINRQAELAYRRCRRYTIPTLALRAANNQKYRVPVLHGDIVDDVAFYLVPGTNRDAGILMRAGYELCDLRLPDVDDMWS
jgi:hypothetical protein